MSADDAVLEAKRAFYWRWINFFGVNNYGAAARHMREAAEADGIENSGRPLPVRSPANTEAQK